VDESAADERQAIINATNTRLADTIIVCWNTSNATVEVCHTGHTGEHTAGTLQASPTK
jgi:hypothetical protein